MMALQDTLLISICCLTVLLVVQCQELSIKLDRSGAPNANVWEGNVMVRRGDGEWGIVCDDRWDKRDGEVVCKQLGFTGVQKVTIRNRYKSDFNSYKTIFLDDVACDGDESSLADCSSRDWGTSNCIVYEAAGVICTPPVTTTPSTPTPHIDSDRRGTEQVELMRSLAHAASQSIDESRSYEDILNAIERADSHSVSIVNPPVASPALGEQTAPELVHVVLDSASAGLPAVAPVEPMTTTSETGPGEMNELDLLLQRINAEAAAASVGESESVAEVPSATGGFVFEEEEEQAVLRTMAELQAHHARPQTGLTYGIQVTGGRSSREGWVKVVMPDGSSGAICADTWTIFEATVVCRQAGLHYARKATKSNYFGGVSSDKLFYEVSCDGHEMTLGDCTHKEVSEDGVKCSRPDRIAGVQCTTPNLPDLIPNVRALHESIHVDSVPMARLGCALEEGCLSSSASRLGPLTSAYSSIYGGDSTYGGLFGGGGHTSAYNSLSRRLLRFSSSIFNNGTADFRPSAHRSSWEFHQCHMHYHSMSEFSHYDILDRSGNRVAEGHKASFCLEDVECQYGSRKKFSCSSYGRQGISPGCADVYKHDIDCQWIDITDLDPGTYIFRVHINPNSEVAELSFDNNAAMCELNYTGYSAKLSRCELSRG